MKVSTIKKPKFMKRFSFALCLSLSNLFSATPDDLTWERTGDEVTITDCDTQASGNLEIPEEIDGMPVSTIGESAFLNCTGLTQIRLLTSIDNVQASAFENCRSLTSVNLPPSLTILPSRIFTFATP